MPCTHLLMDRTWPNASSSLLIACIQWPYMRGSSSCADAALAEMPSQGKRAVLAAALCRDVHVGRSRPVLIIGRHDSRANGMLRMACLAALQTHVSSYPQHGASGLCLMSTTGCVHLWFSPMGPRVQVKQTQAFPELVVPGWQILLSQ